MGEQASLSDYKNSRYDRGHLARANLFTENYESMSTSFLLSNIIPQLKSNNRYGAWKKLEKLEFENIQTRGELLIVSGPVFSLNPKRLGGNKVCVPKSLFKVMLDPNKGDAIGFIIPNDYEVKSYDSFSMSVNEVEKVVGLDFFSELHDEFEETIESESKLLSWVKEASKSNFSINSKDLILSDGYNCGHSMYLTKSNRCYATKAGLKKRVKGVCCDKYLH